MISMVMRMIIDHFQENEEIEAEDSKAAQALTSDGFEDLSNLLKSDRIKKQEDAISEGENSDSDSNPNPKIG